MDTRSIAQGDLLIEHARLIDGLGGAAQEDASVLISGGRIAKFGRQDIDFDGERLDASGLTVLPGLIDSHVHLSSVPGSVYREDSAETMRELRRIHLRAYLACGVTTVLDTGIPTDMAREIQGWLADGHPGPRYCSCHQYLPPPMATWLEPPRLPACFCHRYPRRRRWKRVSGERRAQSSRRQGLPGVGFWGKLLADSLAGGPGGYQRRGR